VDLLQNLIEQLAVLWKDLDAFQNQPRVRSLDLVDSLSWRYSPSGAVVPPGAQVHISDCVVEASRLLRGEQLRDGSQMRELQKRMAGKMVLQYEWPPVVVPAKQILTSGRNGRYVPA